MGQGSETLGDMYDFYDFDEDEFFNDIEIKKQKNNNDKKPTRGSKVEKKCNYCGEKHTVRVADLNRGWGKFCSKTCKAKEQEKRTHQNHNYLMGKS